MSGPTLNEAVEWRIAIWAAAVASALDRAAILLTKHAKVLEVGYNTGMISCYMASRYGWKIVGYDISDSLRSKAEETARRYGLEGETDFRACSPDKTLSIEGPYDAVFLKSVLYHISDKSVYSEWIKWLYNVVRKEGVIIAVENGAGGLLDKFYRRVVKRSRWAGFLLFDKWAEEEFRKKYSYVDIRYFGRFSQFFTSFPKLCKMTHSVEQRFFPANAEHCFIASIVAQK